MPRAYLRLDPAFDERKESYPDGPYAALVACFCQGELQPVRGHFRNEKYLRAILGARGRHVPYLIQHGDLVRLPDGRLYIDGWDEWQEGDWKVQERVGRIRNRARATVVVTPDVTPPTVTPVTVENDTSCLDSGAERSGAVSGSDSGLPRSSDSVAVQTSPPTQSKKNGLTRIEPVDFANGLTLDKRQHDAWKAFGGEWSDFKLAWLSRGLKYPPSGSAEDDPEAESPSQRAMLWSILNSRPNDLVRWVYSAPKGSATEVIAHVLRQWHGVREAAAK